MPPLGVGEGRVTACPHRSNTQQRALTEHVSHLSLTDLLLDAVRFPVCDNSKIPKITLKSQLKITIPIFPKITKSQI